MSDRPTPDPGTLVGGQYLVDVTRILPDAGGGVAAFAASSRGDPSPFMALRVDRRAPARPRPLHNLINGIEGLLTPLAYGAGPPIESKSAWYVICQAPPGPDLSAVLRPWTEPNLIEFVLRPITAALEQLHARGITHRGIRPNNIFQSQPTRPVTLGAAWAAPPAMHQPAVFETVQTAVCHPGARGEGHGTDDIYALGVLLVTLVLGRLPMGGMDDRAILFRKHELGDFVAVTGGERLPPMLADLVRGMLAEDPDHRPTAALLRDPVAARGRRVAARPASRAQRPFKIGAAIVWNTRTLALAIASEPEEALIAIQTGTLMYWLRRGLGDSNLAVKLEELVRQLVPDGTATRENTQAMLLMRAIVDADILMPLCWRGLAIFPDGIGSALAIALEGDTELQTRLHEIVNNEVQGIWAAMREARFAATPIRLEARQRRAVLQIRGPAGGLPRLAYTLNAMTPCASPLLGGRWITGVGELAPALEAIAVASKDADLLEPRIAAFIGARSERLLDKEVQALATDGDGPERTLAALRLFSELQHRYHPAPMQGLTAWIAARAQPLVERWKNRDRREKVAQELKTLVALGFLGPIRTLLQDPQGQAADSEGLRNAQAELEFLDTELRAIAAGSRGRAAFAARLGQEIAAGAGLVAVAVTLILAAIG